MFARPSVFSHHRLLFTVHRHKNEISAEIARRLLEKEVLKVLKDELQARRNIVLSGIKDISERVKLPPNVFTTIDRKAVDYDDMRTCFYCKHICVFSAVACECDKVQVSCVRHYTRMCACAKEKKYLLCWTDTKDMEVLFNLLEAEEEKWKVRKRPGAVNASPVQGQGQGQGQGKLQGQGQEHGQAIPSTDLPTSHLDSHLHPHPYAPSLPLSHPLPLPLHHSNTAVMHSQNTQQHATHTL